MKKIILLIIIALNASFLNAQSNNDLTNTHWTLMQIENTLSNQIQFVDTICGTTLYIDSIGNYKGYSGCNQYSGHFTIKKEKKISMDNPVRTKRGCIGHCSFGETLFDHYPRTNHYEIKNDTLIFWTDNNIKMAFKKSLAKQY